jgi:predicted ABC-type ATPase
LDSDEIKAKLAKADGVQKLGALSESYHEESGDVLQKVFSRALEEKKNIVIDGTLKGQDKAVRMAKDLERIGYKTAAAYADLPMRKAMVRAVERFARGGRFVDPAYIASHDHKNIQTFGALKGIVDEWHHYDTDVPMGQLARHVGSGKKGQKSLEAGVEKEKKGEKAAKWVAVNDGEDRTQDKLLDALAKAKAKPPKKG